MKKPLKKMNQHFVTEKILKEFVDPIKGHLEVYDFNEKCWLTRSNSTKKVASIKNFYDVKGAANPREIEEMFSKFESEIMPLIRNKLFKDEEITNEERGTFSLYLGHSACRTPKHINQLTEFNNISLNEHLAPLIKDIKAGIKKGDYSMIPKELVHKLDDENFKNEVLNYDKKFSVTKKKILGDMFKQSNLIGHAIYRMNWNILIAEGEENFVISDHPLTIKNFEEKINGLLCNGVLTNPSVKLYFPLSPKRCLECEWNVKDFIQGLCFAYGSEEDGFEKLCSHLTNFKINISNEELAEVLKDKKEDDFENTADLSNKLAYKKIQDVDVQTINYLILGNAERYIYSPKQITIDMSKIERRRKVVDIGSDQKVIMKEEVVDDDIS